MFHYRWETRLHIIRNRFWRRRKWNLTSHCMDHTALVSTVTRLIYSDPVEDLFYKKRWMNDGSSHRLCATYSHLFQLLYQLFDLITPSNLFSLQTKRKCYISTHWSSSEYQPILCRDITWMQEFQNDFKLPATLSYSLESCIECIEILLFAFCCWGLLQFFFFSL